jgi:type IV conjugative transfer system protein TraL
MTKRFPQYLSAPLQVLWFEPDELGVVFTCFLFALIYGSFSWALLFIAPWQYSRAKKRYPKGFFRHFLYFVGITRMKGYPSFFEERFFE